MLTADIPTPADLLELIDHRHPVSVTLTIASSPLPSDHERVALGLRNAIDEAERQIATLELSRSEAIEAARVVEELRGLLDDPEFWEQQSRSLVVLAAPGRVQAHRLANTVTDHVAVGDRFDTGALLRSVAFPNRAFVVLLSQGSARLVEIGPDHRPREHTLDLPDDHAMMLEKTTTDGQADIPRADGATGDRIERERYARAVEVLVRPIVPDDVPVILAAATDLVPAYRAVNTHPLLLEDGISAHPESLDDETLSAAVREILDAQHAQELADWREHLGTQQAEGLGSSDLAEVGGGRRAAVRHGRHRRRAHRRVRHDHAGTGCRSGDLRAGRRDRGPGAPHRWARPRRAPRGPRGRFSGGGHVPLPPRHLSRTAPVFRLRTREIRAPRPPPGWERCGISRVFDA